MLFAVQTFGGALVDNVRTFFLSKTLGKSRLTGRYFEQVTPNLYSVLLLLLLLLLLFRLESAPVDSALCGVEGVKQLSGYFKIEVLQYIQR